MNARKRIQDIEAKVNAPAERDNDSELHQLEMRQVLGRISPERLELTPEEEARLEELILLDPYRVQCRRYHTGEDPPPPRPPEEHTKKAACDYHHQFGRFPVWYAAVDYWFEKDVSEPLFRQMEEERRLEEELEDNGQGP